MSEPFAETATDYAVLGSTLGLTGFCLICLVMFHLRRDKQPIRGRVWWQSEALGVLYLSLSVSLAFTSEFIALNCKEKFIASIMAGTVNVMINLRSLHLFAAHQVASDMTAGKYSEVKGGLILNGDNLPKSKGSRLSLKTLAMFQSTRFQLTVFCSSVVIHLVIAIVVAELAPAACEDDAGLMAFIVISYVYFIVFLTCASQMKVLKDELYLKKELAIETFFGTIILVSFMVLRFATPGYLDETSVLVYGMFPLFGAVILMPLVMTYRWERKKTAFWKRYMNSSDSDNSQSNFESDTSKTETNSKGKTLKPKKQAKVTLGIDDEGLPLYALQKILDNAEGQLAFTQYCVLRLAHENMLFYNEARRFFTEFPKARSVDNLEAFSQEIRTIYDRYVAPGSILMVNLPSGILDMFNAAGVNDRSAEVDVKKGKKAMKAAKNEILHVMKYDLYPDFVKHKLYRMFAMKMMMEDANLNVI